jgi:hypothetical protein
MRSSGRNSGLAALLLLLFALLLGQPALAQTLLVYQANPASGAGLPSLDGLPYDRLQALTQSVAQQGSAIARAVDFAGDATIEVVPGGYKLRSDPSIVMRVQAEPRQATLLAAALGYAYRQDSVLVLDMAAADADQFYVRVAFPGTPLTGALADAFFHFAAGVDPGLGEGYTAFGQELVFINLRDDAGEPYSKLDDGAFKAALGKAAARFTGAKAVVAGSGKVEARLVGNDWKGLPDGGTYRTLLSPDTLPALDRIAAEIAAAVRQAAGPGR